MVRDALTAIRDDIRRIDQATAIRDHWAVLGIAPGSDFQQIKAAHRKWIRKLHPDRWFATADAQLYSQIHEAFYRIQVAYFEVLRHCVSRQGEPARKVTITTAPPNGGSENGFFSWLVRFLDK